jgi:hypothetical protein
MNSRKIIVSVFVGLFVSLFIARAAVAQTETLGLVRYTPPKGWAKSAKEHAVVFSDINHSAGSFCFITLYSAGTSTGSPKSDFERDWNERVVRPRGGEANPETKTDADDGWTTVAAAAPIDFNGLKAIAFLTVISGYGKTVSVLGVLNDDSYVAPLTAFAAKLEIDKSNPATVNTPPTATATPATPALQYDDYGHLIIPPPVRQLTLADLAGQ